MSTKRRSWPAEEGTARKTSAPTVVPPFDPSEFARESESMIVAADPAERKTVPPEAFYAELRESISSTSLLAAPRVPFDDSPEVWHSETRVVPELPPLDSRPVLSVSREDLEWFELEADAAALASAANGVSRIAELADACGVERELARRLFRELSEEGIVDLR
jgi:hypothetical protein